MTTEIVYMILLLVVIVLQEIAHRKERKDLYNRIQAGSLDNYNANNPSLSANKDSTDRTQGPQHPIKKHLDNQYIPKDKR